MAVPMHNACLMKVLALASLGAGAVLQVCDEVCSFLWLLQAGEHHLCARNVLRVTILPQTDHRQNSTFHNAHPRARQM
jgi:hypothetical protein